MTKKLPLPFLYKLSLIISGLIIVLCLWEGWNFFQAQQENNRYQALITSQQEQLAELNTEENQQALDLYQTYQTEGELKRARRNWSVILQEVEDTFPDYVTLYTFSADEDTQAQIQVSTDSYDNIVLLLRKMEINPLFQNFFIPSIAQGQTEEGELLYIFPIELDFVETK